MTFLRRFTPVLALCLLTGCAAAPLGNLKNIGRDSDPTRFYTLTATAERAQDTAAMPYTVLGVGPVTVADYIDRSQIVLRESGTELTLADFDRWAGNPAQEVQRVVGANLATLLGTERVVSYPWKSSIDTDMVVEMTIERFEYAEGKVWLEAGWQVFADNGREAVAFRRTLLSRDSGRDYAEIAAGLSQLTGELSAQIADAIRAGYRSAPQR